MRKKSTKQTVITKQTTKKKRTKFHMCKTSVDVSLTVSERLGHWKDDKSSTIRSFERWLNTLLFQTLEESHLKKERCEVCNSREKSTELELHHIGGTKHDFRTTTVCIRCHRILTKWQEQWDLRWYDEEQSEELRKAFVLCGLYDILVLKTRFTCDTMYQEYADYLIDDIHKMRNDKQYKPHVQREMYN